ncbi:MAG: PAS domain S-box protein [Ignavibacteriales bacterium]|nr:MAG: PAS domain S-box protein [Ignavibacteriales bacterium]
MLMEKHIRKIPLPLIIIFFLFVVLISYISIHLYSLSKKEILSQSYQEIAAISKLKVKQISDWRRERIGEAEFIKRSVQFTQLTIAYLSNPSNKHSFDNLVKWIKPLKENHEYIDMILIKPDGSTYPLFSTEPEYLSSADKAINNLVHATGEIKLTDFHQEDDTGDVHIGIVLPIFSDSEKKKDIICTLMMRMDPNKNLFPLIQTWPSLSKTGETLLLKKDGNNVLYLNELRHKKNTTLKLKLPMNSQNLPAAKAAQGFTGLFEGYDYRGVYVLSDINKIPDSPWFIVAKIDMDEILTPLKERTIWNIIFASVIILVTGLGIFIFLKQQQIQNLRKQIVLEQEKLALKKHYEYLILNANDIILLSDDYFEILEVNESALKAYGYTKEEFKKLTIVNIHSPESRRTIAYHKNLIDEQGGLIFETQHIRKNGEIFDVEVSSKLIEIEDKKYYQNIIRDITEKKQYEKKILRHNRVYSVLSNINQTIVRRRNREELFRESCRIAVEDGQFKFTWVGLVDENTKKVIVSSKYGNDEGYCDNISITVDGGLTGTGPTGSAISEGKYFICNDIQTDDRMKPWREEALKRKILSSAAFPLKIFEKTIGSINFYSTERDFFDDQEIKLLEELAMDLSYALEFIEQEDKRRKSEEALKESETIFNYFLSYSPVYVFFKDENIRAIRLSKNFEQMLGRPIDEILGKTMDELFPSDLAKSMIEDDKKILQKGELIVVDEELNGKYYTTIKFPIFIDNKPRYLAGFTIDITERKQAEKQLRERDELLFEMGKLAQVGGWEFDTVTLEGTWTEEVAKIHEVDPGDKTNVEFGSGFYVDQSRTKIEAAIKEAIENGKPYDLELEMISAKGNRKWVRTIGYPVYEGNKIIKVRGSFQDITKIKMVEEEIKKMNEELEKRVAERTKQLEISNKELEAFSYSISHDLRAPLRAINGYSNIVLENYKDKLDDEAAELLNSITANTQKMSQLIDDLLEFSRLGRKELNKLPIDMNELINKILTEQVDELTGDRLDIKIENLPVAKADYSLIKQVIINLLSNAIKFSSTKEKSIIEIGGRAEHDENIYWIKDNGVGFSTKYSDKLFGVFQRLHKDSEFEGTGVGLAIVKRIINKHGGKVWAESIINEGSVFYFSLPEN